MYCCTAHLDAMCSQQQCRYGNEAAIYAATARWRWRRQLHHFSVCGLARAHIERTEWNDKCNALQSKKPHRSIWLICANRIGGIIESEAQRANGEPPDISSMSRQSCRRRVNRLQTRLLNVDIIEILS